MPKKERGLGRGLDALFSSGFTTTDGEVREISVTNIVTRNDQPRKLFDESSLEELALSLREHGMLQPLLVRTRGESYEIIAGERRFRAAQLAGIDKIPVIIKELDDRQAAEVSLVENLQRDDLTVIEEANAYKYMIEQHDYTQEELAERVGKSRTHVTNTMRILSLPDEILELIEKGRLSAGHARALLGLKDQEMQLSAAREIMDNQLSVRKTEEKVRQKKFRRKRDKPVEIIDLEERLEKLFGTKIEVISRRKGGKIEICYYSSDDLQRIIEVLGLTRSEL